MKKSNLPPHVARHNICARRARSFMVLPDGRWQDTHACLTCKLYHVYPPLAKIIRLDGREATS